MCDMSKVGRLFVSGSRAALSTAWGALGGSIGIVMMFITERWIAPVYGAIVGLYVALFIAHHNVSTELEAHRRELNAIQKARPRIEYVQARYSNRIKLAGDTTIGVWQLWFMNRPEYKDTDTTARRLTAHVTFCDEQSSPVLISNGQWAITAMPDHTAWTAVASEIDLPPVHASAKLLMVCQTHDIVTVIDGETTKDERGVYGLAGENLHAYPMTAEHPGYFLEARATRAIIAVTGVNMVDQQFRFKLERSANGTVTSVNPV
jgi:hypothetical protein